MKFIINNLKKTPLDKKFLSEVFSNINKNFTRKWKNYEVIVSFVDDKYIRKLNKRFLDKDSFTDVMAFPMKESFKQESLKKGFSSGVLGDVVISVDRARIQAKKFKNSFKKELALLVIHGSLHLLGYDDVKTKDAIIMRKKEQQILQKSVLGCPD